MNWLTLRLARELKMAQFRVSANTPLLSAPEPRRRSSSWHMVWFIRASAGWPNLELAPTPVVMGQVLGVVYRAIASYLNKAACYHHNTEQTGAVTLIQRFGSALNLNIHSPMLFLDGVHVTTGERLAFRRAPPPTVVALEKLVHLISKRVGRALERQGLLVRDVENSFLTLDPIEMVVSPDVV